MKVKLGEYPAAFSKKKRKIKIRIDPYDVWNADETIALIVHPLLVALSHDKTGVPFVYFEDLSKELLEYKESPLYALDNKENGNAVSDKGAHNQKFWDYVLGEMIFAFQSHLEDPNFDMTHPDSMSYYERQRNGFRLFAKYFGDLWT